ncbi:GNAT family N-acetyltransferase [Candidatus Kaiserbacteria bacterium]|nr:GNAT family N-acetyltransferase [Candidatus Kaiserbacteria bacterium]
MDIRIRDAVPDDAEAVEQVRYQGWLATYPNEEFRITREDIKELFRPQLSPEGIENRRHKISEVQKTGRYVVAKVDGRIVGFCILIRYEEKNQLRGIYVLPGYQGKGVGKALWQEVRASIDPKMDTYVELAAYNAVAIGFYSKFGFKDTGRRFSNESQKLKNGAKIPEMEMRLDKAGQ